MLEFDMGAGVWFICMNYIMARIANNTVYRRKRRGIGQRYGILCIYQILHPQHGTRPLSYPHPHTVYTSALHTHSPLVAVTDAPGGRVWVTHISSGRISQQFSGEKTLAPPPLHPPPMWQRVGGGGQQCMKLRHSREGEISFLIGSAPTQYPPLSQ